MDDVIRNVLPNYRQSLISITDAEYETDVGRIQRAFSTDSKVQREKLVAALRETAFVRAVDAGTVLNGIRTRAMCIWRPIG